MDWVTTAALGFLPSTAHSNLLLPGIPAYATGKSPAAGTFSREGGCPGLPDTHAPFLGPAAGGYKGGRKRVEGDI